MVAAVLRESSARRSLSIPLSNNKLPPKVTKTLVTNERLLGKSSNKSFASLRQIQRRTALKTRVFNGVHEVLMTVKLKRIYSSADKSGGANRMNFPTLFTAMNSSLPEWWNCVGMCTNGECCMSGICGWLQTLFQRKSSQCCVNILHDVWTSSCVGNLKNLSPLLEKYLQRAISFAEYINLDLSKQGCLLGYLRLWVRNWLLKYFVMNQDSCLGVILERHCSDWDMNCIAPNGS
jgi:hypothetical protein